MLNVTEKITSIPTVLCSETERATTYGWSEPWRCWALTNQESNKISLQARHLPAERSRWAGLQERCKEQQLLRRPPVRYMHVHIDSQFFVVFSSFFVGLFSFSSFFRGVFVSFRCFSLFSSFSSFLFFVVFPWFSPPFFVVFRRFVLVFVVCRRFSFFVSF